MSVYPLAGSLGAGPGAMLLMRPAKTCQALPTERARGTGSQPPGGLASDGPLAAVDDAGNDAGRKTGHETGHRALAGAREIARGKGRGRCF